MIALAMLLFSTEQSAQNNPPELGDVHNTNNPMDLPMLVLYVSLNRVRSTTHKHPEKFILK